MATTLLFEETIPKEKSHYKKGLNRYAIGVLFQSPSP